MFYLTTHSTHFIYGYMAVSKIFQLCFLTRKRYKITKQNFAVKKRKAKEQNVGLKTILSHFVNMAFCRLNGYFEIHNIFDIIFVNNCELRTIAYCKQFVTQNNSIS